MNDVELGDIQSLSQGVNMAKVRGVRFSEAEEEMIEEFLRKNPFFDFSTLAKISILDFIRKPEINLTPIAIKSKKEAKDVRLI